LRILAIHAQYVTLGGEDVSHDNEVSFLRSSGHEVVDHRVLNSEFSKRSKPSQVLNTVYNKEQYRAVRAKIDAFKPDVVYANNTFPGLSVSPLVAATESRIPVVQVLRNYRRGCIAGSTFRNGLECTDCVGTKLGLPGLVHRCYRNSLAASAVASASKVVQEKRGWLDTPARFIAVSNHVREHAVASGVPSEKIVVRHNLVWPEPAAANVLTNDHISAPFVYVGRDTPEKGLQTLLKAIKRLETSGFALDVYGCEAPDGFQDDRVRFRGTVPPATALNAMARALRVVVPSTWPEPFGRVVIESLATGTPVIASRVGGMADLGGPGVDLFTPGDVVELSEKLAQVLLTGEVSAGKARVQARAQFVSDFSPSRWLEITETVLSTLLEQGR
jgi:glycosyltransferase involved in cell wall biosynthesis